MKRRISANEDEIEVIINAHYDEDEKSQTCNHIAIKEDSDGESSSKGLKSTVDELKELNLGTPEEPLPIFVSSLLSSVEEQSYAEILSECRDVFACTYKEMPRLDSKVVIHHLGIRHGVRSIKQSQLVLLSELVPRIEAEVNKLIDAGFIRKTWISSIVPVKK